MSEKYDATVGDKKERNQKYAYSRATQIFQNTMIRLKILGDRMLTSSKFHNEGPQLLGATERKMAARPTWRPKLMPPWPKGGI